MYSILGHILKPTVPNTCGSYKTKKLKSYTVAPMFVHKICSHVQGTLQHTRIINSGKKLKSLKATLTGTLNTYFFKTGQGERKASFTYMYIPPVMKKPAQ